MRSFQKILMFLVIATFFAWKPAANTDFEGTFTYIMTEKRDGESKTFKLNFFVKGDKTLVKAKRKGSPYQMQILIDQKQSDFYVMMDKNDRKMAMKQDLGTIRKRAQKEDAGELKINKTNRTKTIKGYECRLYKVEQKDYKGDAWVSNELDLDMRSLLNMLNQKPGKGRGNNKMFPSQYPENGVAMKSEMDEKSGEGELKMYMESVEEKSIPKSRFDISDYQIMELGQGGKPSSR